MKALHLTFRFGEDVVGGAEYLMYMISKKLVEANIDVDIYTTKTTFLTPISRSGVKWDNKIKKKYDIYNGIKIHRYKTLSIPKMFALGFDYLIQKRLDEEEFNFNINTLNIEGGVLGTGWHPLETYGDLKMRWTKKEANFIVNDNKVSKIFFDAKCPKSIEGKLLVNEMFAGSIKTSKKWNRFEFATNTVVGRAYGKIELTKTWHPLKDSRQLGVSISNIGYVSDGVEKTIDIAKDYINILRNDAEIFLNYYRKRAVERPKIYNYLFMGLRGPISPTLLYDLNKNVENFDVILSQMMPFNTINYGTYLGKKHGIPTVLLPLFHPDDSFYHWGHYYDTIKSADMVLTLSNYTKTMILDPMDVPCEVIGGGVDPYEFENPNISGMKFRIKYKLANEPIILFVGRKSYPKRYDLLIKAIDSLNEEGKKCILVIIGPDEDKIPIRSENVLNIGKSDRDNLLDAYDACDIFAMMSESESFGIVYCEAWMRKKPVIGNKYCGPVSTLIEDGVDGFLCDEIDLSEKINILMSDEKLRIKMGENGYEKTLNNYTWDIIGNKVKYVYNQLCEK